jgi:hypothetical protein
VSAPSGQGGCLPLKADDYRLEGAGQHHVRLTEALGWPTEDEGAVL